MTAVQTHSLRPHVFLVKQHHSVDDQMLQRYLERKLIPAFDMFPDVDLANADVDRLMMSSEVADLPIDMFDLVEQSVTVMSELLGIDWVVIPLPRKQELFAAQVHNYEHIRYQAHLHIKHYIKFKNSFTIPYADLEQSLIKLIDGSKNLAELPIELYNLIQNCKPDFIPETTAVGSEPVYENSAVRVHEDANFPKSEYTGSALSSLDKIARSMHVVKVVSKPQAPPVVDNQIVTHDSLAHITHKTDNVNSYQNLHASILSLQDYLRTNMEVIEEYHSDECDIAFQGVWHDDTQVRIQAYSLSDERGHSAWYIKLLQ